MSKLEDYKKALKDTGCEPFEVISEHWGIYSLKDGSYLKLRANVIKISRQIEQDGNMSFNVNSNVSIGVIVPKNLKGTPATKPFTPAELATAIVEDDVDFSIVEEEWSKYKLQDSTILSVKLVPVKVSRTSIYDPNGEPIYNVNNQLLVKASIPEELKKKGLRVQPSPGHPTFIT